MREGWEYKKLGEVTLYPTNRVAIQNLSPNLYVGVENLVKDRGGVSFSEQLPNAKSAIEYINDDILIGNIRPYLKKIWLSNQKGGASGDVIVVRIKDEFVDLLSSAFLCKVLSSDNFFDYDNQNTKGAKMPRGDKKAIAQYLIPLPPKSVQLEIVSELDQINELIRLKKEQLKDYDKLAQSIFYEMFGDPVENESRESKNYKLIELCENKDDIKCGPFGTQLSKSEYVQSGVPVWGIPQINSHFQEPPTCFVSNLKADSLKDYSVKWGDIVMSRKGSVGLCCVFPKNMSSGILHSDVIRLRFDEKMVDSIFMMHYLHFSSFIRHQIKTISHGAIMAGLNVTKLKSLKVILPPLPLQQEFSSLISQIERLKAEVSNAIADLETLLASRMQYWFE